MFRDFVMPRMRHGCQFTNPDNDCGVFHLLQFYPIAFLLTDFPTYENLMNFNMFWYHNIALLEKLDNNTSRLWYAKASREHGLSHNIWRCKSRRMPTSGMEKAPITLALHTVKFSNTNEVERSDLRQFFEQLWNSFGYMRVRNMGKQAGVSSYSGSARQ
jgi:hypothetical protein